MNSSRNKMDQAAREAFMKKLNDHALSNLRKAQARYQAQQQKQVPPQPAN